MRVSSKCLSLIMMGWLSTSIYTSNLFKGLCNSYNTIFVLTNEKAEQCELWIHIHLA